MSDKPYGNAAEESFYRMRDVINRNALADRDSPRDDPETTWLELLRWVIFVNGWYPRSRHTAKQNHIRPHFGNVDTLARLCKLSEGTVIKLLGRLQDLGEIRCVPDPENCTDIYLIANARRVADERKADREFEQRSRNRPQPTQDELDRDSCQSSMDMMVNRRSQWRGTDEEWQQLYDTRKAERDAAAERVMNPQTVTPIPIVRRRTREDEQ